MDEVVVVGVVYQAGRAHEVRDGPDPLGGLAQIIQGFLKHDLFVFCHASSMWRFSRGEGYRSVIRLYFSVLLTHPLLYM